MKVIIVCCILLCAFCGIASANPQATATYMPVEGGYRLFFTVTAGDYSVNDFWIYRADSFDLVAPQGWTASISSGRETDWQTLSPTYYIQPGQSLTGFACTIPEQPQQMWYVVRQQPPSGGYSNTLIPTPVPEPSALMALAGGLAGFGGLALRRKKS